MAVDYDLHRAKVQSRIAAAHAARQPKLIDLDVKPPCDHDMQTFKKTVRVHTHPGSPNFKGEEAYFVVRACTKCHITRTIDYVIKA